MAQPNTYLQEFYTKQITPDLVAQKLGELGFADTQQNNPHHIGSMYEHTAKSLQALFSLEHTPDDKMVVAMLFHDIGKPETKEVNTKTGYDRFLNHAQVSADKFALIGEKMGFDQEETGYIQELIKYHDIQLSKQGKIKNLLNEHPDTFAGDLIVLRTSDVLGQSAFTRSEKLEQIANLASKMQEYGEPTQTRGLKEVIPDPEAYESVSALTKTTTIEHPGNETTKAQTETLNKVWLARTQDGQDVFIDAKTLEHMQAHPDVNMAHIVEAIGKTDDYNGHFKIGPADLGRTIGTDRCVEISDKDNVIMATRKGRAGQTPVLLEDENTKPQDTSKIVTGICLDDDGEHTIFTAFYGDLAPKEPWDQSLSDDRRQESEQFWATHAIVATPDMLEPGWEKNVPEQINAQESKTQAGQDLIASLQNPRDKSYHVAADAQNNIIITQDFSEGELKLSINPDKHSIVVSFNDAHVNMKNKPDKVKEVIGDKAYKLVMNVMNTCQGLQKHLTEHQHDQTVMH